MWKFFIITAVILLISWVWISKGIKEILVCCGILIVIFLIINKIYI